MASSTFAVEIDEDPEEKNINEEGAEETYKKKDDDENNDDNVDSSNGVGVDEQQQSLDNNHKVRRYIINNNNNNKYVNFILKCFKFCCCCECCGYARKKWPRTHGIIMGVVIPLLLLIALSCFLGFFLAQLEAPIEIANNENILRNKAMFYVSSSIIENITSDGPEFCILSYVYKNQTIPTEESVKASIMKIIESGYYGRHNPLSLTNNNSDSAAYVATNNVSHEHGHYLTLSELFFVSMTDGIDITTKPKRISTTSMNEVASNLLNTTFIELIDFMSKCGDAVEKITASILNRTYDLLDDGGTDDLTFNWIRCTEPKNQTKFLREIGDWLDVMPGGKNDKKQSLSKQAQYVEYRFINNARTLYEEYFNDLYNGTNYGIAKLKATHWSIGNATGFEKCSHNFIASGWFWFTVMSTIGYGNTAPVTRGGRVMIYTLGFISILIFAGLLGHAGKIVTTIFDDWACRFKRTRFLQTHIYSQVIFWGCLYYSWMVFIAFIYQKFKEERNLYNTNTLTDTEFPYKDAYWFAFISTTTVGLGDFYLEHSAMIRQDLIEFSLLMLGGFVLLANFLVKLSDLISYCVGSDEKESDLEDNLHNTYILMCGKRRKKKKTNNVDENDTEDNNIVGSSKSVNDDNDEVHNNNIDELVVDHGQREEGGGGGEEEQ